jgi:hypothetical protein
MLKSRMSEKLKPPFGVQFELSSLKKLRDKVVDKFAWHQECVAGVDPKLVKEPPLYRALTVAMENTYEHEKAYSRGEGEGQEDPANRLLLHLVKREAQTGLDPDFVNNLVKFYGTRIFNPRKRH